MVIPLNHMIKLITTGWAGYVARMGEKRNAYRVWGGNLNKKKTARKTRTCVGG
jgi:hypothetical protein